MIRKHSLAASEQVKLHGNANDLIDRLRSDPAFSRINWVEVLNPSEFTGRSSAQVTRFVAEVVEPIRKRYREQIKEAFALRV